MPEQPILLPEVDTPPKSGVYVDHDEHPITVSEVIRGALIRVKIDPEDDFDNGL
ncbi:MAG: hypothetical protein L0Z63_11535 [Actinobacteria bacterium]|nr:hypothetical protein [Actinomycetota bacterium]